MRKTLLSHLIVLAYADEYRATEVLATLQRLPTGALLDAQDAASAMRANWNVIKLQYGGDLRANAERTGWFWRVLISSLLLAPGGSTQRTSPEAYGLDADFLRSLAAALPPGSSAVWMIVPRAALTRVLPELRHFGWTLLKTPIDRAVITRVRTSSSPSPPDQARAGG